MIFPHKFWGKALSPPAHSGFLVSYAAEPFLSNILSHSAPSAYPANRAFGYSPFEMLFLWDNPADDAFFYGAIRQSTNRIRDVALREGQDVGNAAKYPNYAIFDTPLEEIYGVNLNRLRKLKNRVDPGGVMGLAGGFKFK